MWDLLSRVSIFDPIPLYLASEMSASLSGIIGPDLSASDFLTAIRVTTMQGRRRRSSSSSEDSLASDEVSFPSNVVYDFSRISEKVQHEVLPRQPASTRSKTGVRTVASYQ